MVSATHPSPNSPLRVETTPLIFYGDLPFMHGNNAHAFYVPYKFSLIILKSSKNTRYIECFVRRHGEAKLSLITMAMGGFFQPN